MQSQRGLPVPVILVALLLGVVVGPSATAAAAGAPGTVAVPPQFDQLRARAEQFERLNQWDRACAVYDAMVTRDNAPGDLKERYLYCLRHVHQLRRHRDASFRQTVGALSFERALDVFEEVLAKLSVSYAEHERVELTRLLRAGAEELAWALGDDDFARDHSLSTAAVPGFQESLRAGFPGKTVSTIREARTLVRDAARAAQRSLGLRPTVAVMEFACAACNDLDPHTMALSPGQLGAVQAALDAGAVGVGLDVVVRGQSCMISQVAQGGPAALAGINTDDRIVRIDGKLVQHLDADGVAELLHGDSDTLVELEILSPGQTVAHTVKLVRQFVVVPTIVGVQLLEEGVGYCHLVRFQASTLHELDDALLRLRTMGMRVLVIDLRGNPGGLFKVAVQVAERFLPEGIIVSTRGQLRTYTHTYLAHGGVEAVEVPLVLVIDGETASAAEVVAGALKENQRALLVGQPSFGKGSIQSILELKTIPAGIRITLARFFSPSGQPYTGRGVTPHVLVDRFADVSSGTGDPWVDPQVRVARQEARRLK